MTAPKSCPVCGSKQVQQQRITNGFRSDSQPPRLLTYRCANGHVFLVDAAPDAAAQSANTGT